MDRESDGTRSGTSSLRNGDAGWRADDGGQGRRAEGELGRSASSRRPSHHRSATPRQPQGDGPRKILCRSVLYGKRDALPTCSKEKCRGEEPSSSSLRVRVALELNESHNRNSTPLRPSYAPLEKETPKETQKRLGDLSDDGLLARQGVDLAVLVHVRPHNVVRDSSSALGGWMRRRGEVSQRSTAACTKGSVASD